MKLLNNLSSIYRRFTELVLRILHKIINFKNFTISTKKIDKTHVRPTILSNNQYVLLPSQLKSNKTFFI